MNERYKGANREMECRKDNLKLTHPENYKINMFQNFKETNFFSRQYSVFVEFRIFSYTDMCSKKSDAERLRLSFS